MALLRMTKPDSLLGQCRQLSDKYTNWGLSLCLKMEFAPEREAALSTIMTAFANWRTAGDVHEAAWRFLRCQFVYVPTTVLAKRISFYHIPHILSNQTNFIFKHPIAKFFYGFFSKPLLSHDFECISFLT